MDSLVFPAILEKEGDFMSRTTYWFYLPIDTLAHKNM